MTKLLLRLHYAFRDKVNNIYHFMCHSNFPLFLQWLSLSIALPSAKLYGLIDNYRNFDSMVLPF